MRKIFVVVFIIILLGLVILDFNLLQEVYVDYYINIKFSPL